jgi:Mg2+-importing ATPase
MALPFTPLGAWFGFVTPPPLMLAAIGSLVVVYLACAELIKPFAIRSPPAAASGRSKKT